MIIITIDNTSTSGTFFDNIHNQNIFAYDFIIYTEEGEEIPIDEIIGLINPSSKVYVNDTLGYVNNVDDLFKIYEHYEPTTILPDVYSTQKYDYITSENIDLFKTPKYNKLFNDFNNMFILSEIQFNNYKVFGKNHRDCRISEDGSHNYGTIGGGLSLIYEINYCSEELFPKFGVVGAKCHTCNTIDNLCEDNEKIDNFEQEYKLHKKYGVKMNIVEFYRFITIYNEFKSTMRVQFMGTGLGWIVTVFVKDFVFDITDSSHW